MAIVSVSPLPGRTSSINERFEVEYSRPYLVISNDVVNDDEWFIRANCGFSLFSAHPNDPFARLRSIVPRETGETGYFDDASPGVLCSKWIVVVTWGYINPFESAASGDPAECPVKVVIEGIKEEKAPAVDINGTPIRNSAGDPFDPPVVRDELRCVIKVSRNERDVSPAQILAFANRINDAPWQGLDRHTCKMDPPIIEPVYSMFLNVIYYSVQYTILYNPDGWEARPVDAGPRAIDRTVSPPRLKEIPDLYGQPSSDPALLDGSGGALPLPVDKNSVVLLSFDVYDEADFEALGFPENIFVTVPG